MTPSARAAARIAERAEHIRAVARRAARAGAGLQHGTVAEREERQQSKVRAPVSVRVFDAVERAVEAGAVAGARRATKHTESPSVETIAEQVTRAVMAELCDVLNLEGGE